MGGILYRSSNLERRKKSRNFHAIFTQIPHDFSRTRRPKFSRTRIPSPCPPILPPRHPNWGKSWRLGPPHCPPLAFQPFAPAKRRRRTGRRRGAAVGVPAPHPFSMTVLSPHSPQQARRARAASPPSRHSLPSPCSQPPLFLPTSLRRYPLYSSAPHLRAVAGVATPMWWLSLALSLVSPRPLPLVGRSAPCCPPSGGGGGSGPPFVTQEYVSTKVPMQHVGCLDPPPRCCEGCTMETECRSITCVRLLSTSCLFFDVAPCAPRKLPLRECA